ncbi:hypothetical protein KUCAC02_028839, partial [Chaenocephalus aceratus]
NHYGLIISDIATCPSLRLVPYWQMNSLCPRPTNLQTSDREDEGMSAEHQKDWTITSNVGLSAS